MMRIAILICLLPAALAQAAPPCGWRGDGSGWVEQFEWSAPAGPKPPVLWRTELPDRTTASPVVAGNRLFTMVEPHWLYCLDAPSGKILWQREINVLDLLPPDQVAPAKQLFAKTWAATNELRRKGKEAPDELQAEVKKLWADLRPHGLYQTEWLENGFTSATPVTDGQFVYVKLGTGIAACFDLDGNLKWKVPWPAFVRDQELCVQSPLLADGKLIFTWNPPAKATGEPEHCNESLLALDPATGRELWRSSDFVRTPGWLCATPALMRLGNTTVAITGGGVFRLSDGKLLASKVCFTGSASSPVVRDDIVYALDMESHTMSKKPENCNEKGSRFYAVKLALAAPDKVQATELWRVELKADRCFPTPIVTTDHVYIWNTSHKLLTLRRQTGQLLSERRLKLAKGWNYSSAVLGGQTLFLPASSGQLAIAEAAPQGKILATWDLLPFSTDGWLGEQMAASPLLHNHRLYLRTGKALYCLGQP